MMNLLEKSTVSFLRGTALSSADLNSVVTSQNAIVDALNNILKSFCDINQETGEQKVYTLEQAIGLVPPSRRSFTMKIRFIENMDLANSNIRFAEYFYTGPKNFSDEEWNTVENWSRNVPCIIDGGEW